MIRSRWVDISPAWVDYVEARVEALSEENRRLRRTIEFLKGLDNDLADGIIVGNEYPVPSVLVQTVPVSDQINVMPKKRKAPNAAQDWL